MAGRHGRNLGRWPGAAGARHRQRRGGQVHTGPADGRAPGPRGDPPGPALLAPRLGADARRPVAGDPGRAGGGGRAIQTRLVEGERWVMDGNYGATLPIRVAAADTVVFVDLPRRISIPRAVLRSWRSRGRDVQAFGCPERADWEFLVSMWVVP